MLVLQIGSVETIILYYIILYYTSASGIVEYRIKLKQQQMNYYDIPFHFKRIVHLDWILI